MVKLRDAKCPNCGANIEVNESLEKTICQYCGSTVIIEEAIQKYKIELSGKVEVEGIKGRTSKLTQAKKHMALKENGPAERILLEIVKEDPFDVEAYVELLKIEVIKLEEFGFVLSSSRQMNPNGWKLLEEFYAYYDRVQKIDDSKMADTYLEDYKERVHNYANIIINQDEEKKHLDELANRLNMKLKESQKISWNYADKWLKEVVGKYFTTKGMQITYAARASQSDTYYVENIKTITRDGAIIHKCTRATSRYDANPIEMDLWILEPKLFDSMEEIEKSVEQIENDTQEFIKISTVSRGEELEIENKNLAKENKKMSMDNKFKSLIIGILFIWVLLLVLFTIYMFQSEGFLPGLGMIFFIDSWSVTIPWSWIQSLKEIKSSNKEQILKNKAKIQSNKGLKETLALKK